MQVYAVKFCVGEAIANAVKHAYPESEPGLVDVSAQEVGDELVVTVADHGRRRVNQRTHTEDEGGFGLAFISRLTDGCTFTAARDGTTVEMLFPLRSVKARATSGSFPLGRQLTAVSQFASSSSAAHGYRRSLSLMAIPPHAGIRR